MNATRKPQHRLLRIAAPAAAFALLPVLAAGQTRFERDRGYPVREAHDESGLGFGVTPRTPQDRAFPYHGADEGLGIYDTVPGRRARNPEYVYDPYYTYPAADRTSPPSARQWATERGYDHGRMWTAEQYDPYAGQGYSPGAGRPMMQGYDQFQGPYQFGPRDQYSGNQFNDTQQQQYQWDQQQQQYRWENQQYQPVQRRPQHLLRQQTDFDSLQHLPPQHMWQDNPGPGVNSHGMNSGEMHSNRRDEPGFGYYYRWNPSTEQWDLHYGYHATRYMTDQAFDAQRQQQGGDIGWNLLLGAAAEQPALSGSLVNVRRMELLPQHGDAAVATLRLRDGSAEYVSLGRWEDARRLDLRRGDWVTVRGRQGFVGASPIFMANTLDYNGERVLISQPVDLTIQDVPGQRYRQRRMDTQPQGYAPAPPMQQQQRQQMQMQPRFQQSRFGEFQWEQYDEQREFPAAFERHDLSRRDGVMWAEQTRPAAQWTQPQNDRFRRGEPQQRQPIFAPARLTTDQPSGEIGGRVEELFYTNIPGVSQDDVLVRLRLSGDRERLVNLGAGLSPYQLEQIENADNLLIRGRQAEIRGEQVIIADQVRVDGSIFGVRQRN